MENFIAFYWNTKKRASFAGKGAGATKKWTMDWLKNAKCPHPSEDIRIRGTNSRVMVSVNKNWDWADDQRSIHPLTFKIPIGECPLKELNTEVCAYPSYNKNNVTGIRKSDVNDKEVPV